MVGFGDSRVQHPVTEVRFRPVVEADRGFLRGLYAATREEELAAAPWPVAAKEAFLDQQFAAQDHSYRANYPGAELLVILAGATPAGRLYLHARADEVRIMDIALLPAWRRRGLGTAILQAVLAHARSAGRSVSIHVESFNPAQRLYARLGFRPVGRNDVYVLLEWRPGADPVKPVG